jgi:O-antigen ligase
LYHLYRSDGSQKDAAYLHDDWLELTITFGLIGFGLLLAALVLSALRWFVPGGIASDWPFAGLLWLSLAGCLFHARFDFPFRIQSIVLLFVLVNSVALVVSWPGRKA